MSNEIQIDLLATPQIVEVILERSKPAIEVQIKTQSTVSAELVAAVTAGGVERSIYSDASRPIAYVGYANRIVRLDYATWAPTEALAITTDIHTDWPNRASLTYT